MVRTRADNTARKAVAAKAPRKVLGASSSAASSSAAGIASPSGKYAGGNPACPRPTPDWQKGISGFLKSPNLDKENEEPMEEETGACSSMKECGSSGKSSSPAPESQESSASGSSSSKSRKNGLIDSDSEDE